MADPPVTVEQAIESQAVSCGPNGSALYGLLLTGLLADYRNGGLTAEFLDGVSAKPWNDAIALRYLATAHRLALSGAAPRLARHYPSCGGRWGGDEITDDFLTVVAENRSEFRAGMRRNVQTNEVGRAAVLASGFALIASRFGPVLDTLELGSSAGLLSRWDRYHYATGDSGFGDESSGVGFDPSWWVSPTKPGLGSQPRVRNRSASDISPIDISTADGRLTMLSFVWPDQLERVDRLRAALAIATEFPVRVEQADAGEWLARRLAEGLRPGASTVVFHSIVWQYLGRATKDAVRTTLNAAGALARQDTPLLWLRMEPATTAHADLRLTTWPGGDDEVLANVGYHGAGIRWLL